jgi:hypothetical protein
MQANPGNISKKAHIMMNIVVPFCARARAEININNKLLFPTTYGFSYEPIRAFCPSLTFPCTYGIITSKNQYISDGELQMMFTIALCLHSCPFDISIYGL